MPLVVISMSDGAVEGRRYQVATTVYQKHRPLQSRKTTYRG